MRPARWRCQNIGVAVVVIGGKAAVGDDDCHMAGVRGERRSHLGLGTVVARRAFTGGEQAIAEHSRWIEDVRARVDVDLSGVRDELGGVVKLRGVEQLLRFGQRGLVEPLHALHNLQAILSLSTRDAKEILIPRVLPGRALDSSSCLSNLTIWHYNHHRHAHNVALNQEEKTYGSV